jgi:hypothetical protein
MMFVPRVASLESIKSDFNYILSKEISNYSQKFKTIEEFFEDNQTTRLPRLKALNEEYSDEDSISDYIQVLKSKYESDPEIKKQIDELIEKPE